MKLKNKDISSIKKACIVGDSAFKFILPFLKENVSEIEIAIKLSKFIRKNSKGQSFRTIIAFGKNTAEVHHKPNNTTLKNGDFIMLDFGAKINDFCSDMTRTLFLGKPNFKQKKMYLTVLNAQQKVLYYLYDISVYHTNNEKDGKKDILGFEVDKIARDYILEKGYPDVPHGLGHGVGKKVHTSPRLSPKTNNILKPGMVFSIEPGIYIKDFGGVRIEDLVLLKKGGIEVITKSPKEIIIL